jgi:hypothetical protein
MTACQELEEGRIGKGNMVSFWGKETLWNEIEEFT